MATRYRFLFLTLILAAFFAVLLKPGTGSELYDTIREACGFAREGSPGPVFVEVPANLYLEQHRFDAARGVLAIRPRGMSHDKAGGCL